MVKKLSKTQLCICAVLVLLTTGCGAKYMVKGQVVDGKTDQPVEGAAFVIRWTGHTFGPPYASGAYTLEVAEGLTDENGAFQIPKYMARSFHMGVYKKGYVCWDSRYVLLKKTAKGYQDSHFKHRKGFKVENGMKIKLEVLTNEYSRNRHAHFTGSVAGECEAPYMNGIFREAIKSETDLSDKLWRSE